MALFLLNADVHPSIAALRGTLFEHYAHRMLCNGGQFQTRKLDDNTIAVLVLPRLPLELVKTEADINACTDFIIVSVTNTVCYMQPRSRNYPTVDSFIPSLNTAFQMTVSDRHPIKYHYLKSLCKALGISNKKRKETKFYFVVPPDRYDGFAAQTIVTLVDTPLATTPNLAQYVLKLDITNPHQVNHNIC